MQRAPSWRRRSADTSGDRPGDTGGETMLRRGTAALAGGLALGLMAGAAMAQDAVTLNVWSDTPRLTMFDLYDKTHDNVTLNVTTVAPADLIAKIQLALQAKSEIPDVIFMSDI